MTMDPEQFLRLVVKFTTSSYLREVRPLNEIEMETSEFDIGWILSNLPMLKESISQDTLNDLENILLMFEHLKEHYSFDGRFDLIRIYTRGVDVLSINFPSESPTGKGIFVNVDLYKKALQPRKSTVVLPQLLIPIGVAALTVLTSVSLVKFWPDDKFDSLFPLKWR